MYKISAFLLLIFPVLAQGVTITPSAPVTVVPGVAFTLSISHNLSATTALQWSLALPAGWTASTPSTAVANKVIACNTANTTCIIYGGSTAAAASALIPVGIVATLQIMPPASAVPGLYTISTSGLMEGVTTPPANAIPATSGSATITIIDPRDLNGDGAINQTDADLALSQIFASCPVTATTPLCDVVRMMLVIFKVKGLTP